MVMTFEHGSLSGYNTHGCRCDECRSAAAAYSREWRNANRERSRANARKSAALWAKKFPGKNADKTRLRRMRLRDVKIENYGGFDAIYDRDNGLCTYCGDETIRTSNNSNLKQATLDHVVPVSARGPDVEANVVLACRHCNTSKRQRSIEFMEEQWAV